MKMRFLVAGTDSCLFSKVNDIADVYKPNAQVVISSTIENMFLMLNNVKDFDLVFIDLDFLGKEWRYYMKRIISKIGDARLVIVTNKESVKIFSFLFDSGVYSYILKKYDGNVLKIILELLVRGFAYFPPELIRQYALEEDAEASSDFALPEGKHLTPRQRQVLICLGRGLSNKEIAAELSISEATVKLHVNNLMRVMDVDNRTQIVLMAQKLGFLP